MSIRGRGPDSVIVQPRKVVLVKGAPSYVDDGDPVLIEKCDVQSVREWATAEENLEFGLTLLSMRRVFTRKWAGDVNALAYFDGDLYEVVGDPQKFGRTKRTAHMLITIRRIGTAEPPALPPAP